MSYYIVCPDCGCNLDPGEKCKCGEIRIFESKRLMSLLDNEKDGQVKMRLEDMLYGT